MTWIGVTKKRKKYLIQLLLVSTPNRLRQITSPPPPHPPPKTKTNKQTNMNHLSLPRLKQGFVIKQNRGITWSCLYKPPLSRQTVSGTDKYFKYSKYNIILQNYYSTELLTFWIFWKAFSVIKTDDTQTESVLTPHLTHYTQQFETDQAKGTL